MRDILDINNHKYLVNGIGVENYSFLRYNMMNRFTAIDRTTDP